ncbi:MAG: hypothetical protein IJ661_04495 [Lachnospiraceae bacterium]|nr:hypothetical protein [Lachnospiraceae bacterium]
MFRRNEPQFKKEQENNIQLLINEAVDGITERDILPNTAQPLQGEVEAMYFNALNQFFETSLSRRIMNIDQDLYEGKY